MVSFVSVISVNLVTLFATPRLDSARVIAMRPIASPEIGGTGSASADQKAAAHQELLATARRYLGTRYRFGGAKPGAFDCSGFVRYVFARNGVELPRTATEQSEIGRSLLVGLDSIEVGDLLFFRTYRGRASHVAIYVGDGRIIHASAGSKRVRYDDLDSPRGRWFIEHLSSVRRVLDYRETGKGEAGD